LKLHPAMQKLVLRHALKYSLGTLRGITAAHIEGLILLCLEAQSGDQLQLPHESTAIRQFDELSLLRHTPASSPRFHYELPVPGQCHVPESQGTFTAKVCRAPAAFEIVRQPNQAFLESTALPGSLIIRSRMPGDRYGGIGHRKVKKLLIDHKIPLARRSVLPMVVVGKDVIWIPGFQPSRAYEARPGSEAVVVLEFRADNP
jgi:tRNA(Ile)-lysidine synthase